jgi:apolipoprotein N-acyltransferase
MPTHQKQKNKSFLLISFLAVLSFIFYWASLPPLNLSFLVWLVPICWGLIINHNAATKFQNIVCGLFFYLSCTAFWFITVYWVGYISRIGWVILSFYLALWGVVFIFTTKFIVRSLRIPIYCIAPIVWCSTEWLRKNCFGGFSFASLEHSQYQNVLIIQISDIIGEYGLGMVIVFVGTCVSSYFIENNQSPTMTVPFERYMIQKILPLGGAFVAVIFMIFYGYVRLHVDINKNNNENLPSLQIALLQGDVADSSVERQMFDQYKSLSAHIAHEADVIVWPELSLPVSYHLFHPDFIPKGWESVPADEIKKMVFEKQNENKKYFFTLIENFNGFLILGCPVKRFGTSGQPQKIFQYNSAIVVSPTNETIFNYDKKHLVMFGEYLPLKNILSNYFQWTPFYTEFDFGSENKFFRILKNNNKQKDYQPFQMDHSFIICTNICFDSSLPHYIHNQIQTQRLQGHHVDILINLSNNTVFRHSSQIDLHLATHVFRAVENRKPYLSVTEGGYSVWINKNGRIINQKHLGNAVIKAVIKKNLFFI